MERILEVTLSIDDDDVCEVGIHDEESGDWIFKDFEFPIIKEGHHKEYSDWAKKIWRMDF